MAYASRLYPRAEPRGFTLQRIKPHSNHCLNGVITPESILFTQAHKRDLFNVSQPVCIFVILTLNCIKESFLNFSGNWAT